jgi:hypothetical protein
MAERELVRRAAEQREHAEMALRLELEDELGRRAAHEESLRTALGELGAAEERIRRLEAERDRLLERDRQLTRPDRPQPTRLVPELEPEFEIAKRVAPAVPPAVPPAVEPHRSPAPAELRALERELAQVQLRQRPHARGEPAAGRPPGRALEMAAVVAQLRVEFDGLRALLEHERGARAAAEMRVAELRRELHDQGIRSARVHAALADLRGLLETARHDVERERATAAEELPEVPASMAASIAAGMAAGIEAGRLDAARARLRETVASPEPAERAGAERSVRPWIEPAFKQLLADDPETAGTVLIGLLPAQALAHPAPISYDLRLAPGDYLHVTVAGDPPATEVSRSGAPRAREQRSFSIEGDPGALARTVAAGPLRRRFGRRMARIEGSRSAFAALPAILRLDRGLDQLIDAGLRLDPERAFALAAAMIDPRWTSEQQFTIGHSAGMESASTGPTFLQVRRGERAAVSTTPPSGKVAATVVCPDGLLLDVLAGRRDPGARITGDEAAVATVIEWLDRAQRR